MAITSNAPKGWNYQYKVSSYLGLLLLTDHTDKNAKLFIESKGIEDAFVELVINHQPSEFDVQAKSHKGTLDWKRLCEWLCHFPPHKSSDCLLQSLLDTNDKTLLLITNSRCTDSTKQLFVNSGIYNSRSFIKFSKKTKEGFLSALKKFRAGKSALDKKRTLSVSTISKQLEKNKVKLEEALNKILIWENHDDTFLDSRIKEILNSKFQIPNSVSKTVADALFSITEEKGRDEKANVIPLFNSKLNHFKSDRPIVVSNYFQRGIESALVDFLKKNNCLFLSGSTLCGKSQTAKFVADYFVEMGYSYKHSNDVYEASRFLGDNVSDDRICLIEDPAGHSYDGHSTLQKWNYIISLVNNLPPGRKAIVTTNSIVSRNLSLPQNSHWHDLTLVDRQIAIKLWHNICNSASIDISSLSQAIISYLENCQVTEILQPGQLEYIFNNQRDLMDYSANSIRHLALVDSKRLTEEFRLKSKECQEVLIALALTSDTIRSIEISHLAYILSDDSYFPAINKQDGAVAISIWPSKRKKEIVFPKYESLYSISPIFQEQLDFLEERGFIQYINHQNSYVFTHPLFLEASRYLMKSLPVGKFNVFLKLLKRSIACLSSENTLHTVKQFRILYSFYSGSFAIELLNISFSSLNSIFPAVQDTSLVFLIKNYSQLTPAQQDKVTRIISENDSGNIFIRWHDQIPYTLKKSNSFVEVDLDSKLILSLEQYNELKQGVIDGRKLTKKEAWQLCYYIQKKSEKAPIAIDRTLQESLINFDEVFIREVIAFHIMWQNDLPTINLIDKLFSDEHPFVVLEAIKGTIRGWHLYPDNLKNHLYKSLNNAFQRLDVVITSTHFMTQFGIGYSGRSYDWLLHIDKGLKDGMWKLWGKLMPLFFKFLPADIRFNTGRFVKTMDDSIQYLSSNNKMAITIEWMEWFEKNIKVKPIDPSLMQFIDYFFKNADEAGSDRISTTKLLLANNHPLISAHVLRFMIYNYNLLFDEEKEEIKARLNKGDLMSDAVAITVVNSPEELQVKILGRCVSEFISGEGNWTSKEQLLKNCMGILYGDPYFDYLEYGDKTKWQPFLRLAILNNNCDYSLLGVKEMLEDYFFDYKPKKWGESVELISHIINSQNSRLQDFTLCYVCYFLTNYKNHNKIEDYAPFLMDLPPEKKIWLQKTIIENIESFCLIENLEVADYFLEGNLIDNFQDEFELLQNVGVNKSKKNIASNFDRIREYVESNDKRLFILGVDGIIHWVKSNFPHEKEFLRIIEREHLKQLDLANSQGQKLKLIIYEELKKYSIISQVGTTM